MPAHRRTVHADTRPRPRPALLLLLALALVAGMLAVGSPMSIVRFYYTGDRRFPNEVERRALRQGGRERLLFASWKPAAGQTWRDVAAGKADAMLKRQADYLREHWNRPMYLALHHEPEDDVRPGAGSGYQARDFAAMFRHVRSVFERRGVDKAVWVMNYMGFQRWHLEPWFDQLWPGDSQVDWIAYDPYKTERLGGFEGGYAGLVNRHYGTAWNGFYRWASKHHAGTPIMLGEWGIAERKGKEKWKSVFFRRLARKVSRTPQIRAMLYFDHDFAQAAGDVSLDTSEYSLKGYRRFLQSRVIARIG